MLSFMISLIFAEEEDEIIEPERCKRKFMVGGASTSTNPWWSQPLIGIHKHMKTKPVIHYSSDERTALLDFRNSTIINYSSKYFEDVHYQKWQKIANESAYINFYVDGYKIKANLFDTNTKNVFTFFNITVYEIQSNCNKLHVEVNSLNPTEIAVGKSLTFTYQLNYEPFIEFSSEKNNTFNIYTLIFIVVLIIFAIVLFISYKKIKSGGNIPYVDIWRIPSGMRNEFVFVSFGGFIISYLITILITHKSTVSFSMCFLQAVIPALVVPTMIQAATGRFFRFNLGDEDYLSPSLFFCCCFVCPYQIITFIISYLTKSLRGMGATRTFFWDFIMMMTLYSVARGSGGIGYLYPVPINTETTLGDAPMDGYSSRLLETILDLVQSAVTTAISYEAFKNVLAYAFEQEKLNSSLIISSVFAILAIALLMGAIHGFVRIRKPGASWMAGHAERPAISLIATLALCLYVAYPHCLLYSLWAYMAFAAFCTAIVVYGVNSFGSFYGSFIIAMFSFTQAKKN